MKFKLSTSDSFYSEGAARKLERLGFEFEPYEDGGFSDLSRPMYMLDKEPEIEIGTLEDLITFSNQWGQIIVNGDCLEIYDGYRE